jgi:hypothetical protein
MQKVLQITVKIIHLKFDMDTFGGDLKLAALGNLDSLQGLVSPSSLEVLDLVDKLVSLKNFAKDNVSAIEPTVIAKLVNSDIGGRYVDQRLGVAIRRNTHEVTTVVMKNWEPLVSFPALAMESRPGLVCLSLKFSSLNLAP